jgi:signal transduction histidine kinase
MVSKPPTSVCRETLIAQQKEAPDRTHDAQLLELARRRDAEKVTLATTGAGMGTWEMFSDGSAAWDAQTYRLYGYDPGTNKLPSDIFREALTEAEYLRTSNWLSQSLKDSISVSIEFALRWPDGETRWLAAKGKPFLDANGRRSLLGINWDITDQRRTLDALHKHQQELSSLTQQLHEQERQTTKKLAQILHDQLGQTLTAARLALEMQLRSQPSAHTVRADAMLSQAMEQLRGMLVELRPPILEEQGLGPALDNETQRQDPANETTELIFQASDGTMQGRWPSEVEYAFFMIAREAISNALAHAKAHLILVQLTARHNDLTLEITDDGCGFAFGATEVRPGHLGLIGMRERAQGVGARLIFSSQPDQGCSVTLTWTPLP